MPILDTLGRPLGSLRISVTDRCNLRCQYCMPEPDYVWLPRESLLTFEELGTIVDAFTAVGADRVRITGGEPLRGAGQDGEGMQDHPAGPPHGGHGEKHDQRQDHHLHHRQRPAGRTRLLHGPQRPRLDARHDHIEGGGVESAFGDDHIRVPFRGFDKFEVHGPHCGLILLDDRLGCASAFGEIALKAADESQIGIGIHENFDIEQFAELGFRKDQYPFHNDDTARLNGEGFLRPPIGGEIVDGNLNRLPVAE